MKQKATKQKGFEAKAKDLTLRGQGQGLQRLSSRTSSRTRTSSRPPPLFPTSFQW